MQRERDRFVPGATRRGLTAIEANALFEYLMARSRNLFGKAHALAATKLTCQTAYPRHHYPREYLRAQEQDVSENPFRVELQYDGY